MCIWTYIHTFINFCTIVHIFNSIVASAFHYNYTMACSHRWHIRNSCYVFQWRRLHISTMLPQNRWARFNVNSSVVLCALVCTLYRVTASSTVFCSWLRLRIRTSPPLLSAQARDSSEEWSRWDFTVKRTSLARTTGSAMFLKWDIRYYRFIYAAAQMRRIPSSNAYSRLSGILWNKA